VVLDYDGTLCETKQRQQGLSTEVAAALTRIARAGLTIGIITGRGKSVREDLQRELPASLWKKFLIGYYNGSDIASLEDTTRPLTGNCCEGLAQIEAFLKCNHALAGVCDYEARPSQIQVNPSSLRPITHVWEVLQHSITATSSRASVVRSGHSFDVLADGVSKRAILDKLRQVSHEAILCIGDSGRWPGNDFALLTDEFSLSVHEVSSDLKTCWNLARPGERGVAATLYYLRSLRPSSTKGQMTLNLPVLGKGER
jgi:hypothetical protein